MITSKEERHDFCKPCEEAAVMWLQLNGCTDAHLVTKHEDQRLDFDIVASGDIWFGDDGEEHRIDLKSTHWSFKSICCTRAVCFEVNKHAGLEYDPAARSLRVMKKKFNPSSAATDILFALLDTKWSECLLVRRDCLEKYAKSRLEYVLHVSYLRESGDTLVWLPLSLMRTIAWKKFDMSSVFFPL